MDAQLLIWIVETCTEHGETILDPMAGSGTTMLACTLGRNVVLVELKDLILIGQLAGLLLSIPQDSDDPLCVQKVVATLERGCWGH